MKRLLALILALCCLAMFALASCSKNEGQNNGEQGNDGQKETANGDAEGGNDENAEGYKFSIDGEVYALPNTIGRFLDSGYEFGENDRERILDTSDMQISVEMLKDGVRVCNLYVIKDGDNINDAKVLGVALDEDSWGTPVAFENLEIGKATLEDVIDTLGEPVNDYDETAAFTVLEFDVGEEADLSVNILTGTVSAIYYWGKLK